MFRFERTVQQQTDSGRISSPASRMTAYFCRQPDGEETRGVDRSAEVFSASRSSSAVEAATVRCDRYRPKSYSVSAILCPGATRTLHVQTACRVDGLNATWLTMYPVTVVSVMAVPVEHFAL